jgi:hypothetical protein
MDFGRATGAPLVSIHWCPQTQGEPSVRRVVACDLYEAIAYMGKWHPDLDIQHVELAAIVEMVSGSPLN